jgi:hypothetical protein
MSILPYSGVLTYSGSFVEKLLQSKSTMAESVPLVDVTRLVATGLSSTWYDIVEVAGPPLILALYTTVAFSNCT